MLFHSQFSRIFRSILYTVAIIMSIACADAQAKDLDLSKASIVFDGKTVPQQRAVRMLQEEMKARTGITVPITATVPDGAPAIVVGLDGALPGGAVAPPRGLTIPSAAEGYGLWVDVPARGTARIYVVGHDDRGVLYGVGKLLRSLHMSTGALSLAKDTATASAPAYPLRGHQIGYRNTANSYDAWDIKQYEQYIRDMAVFGTNVIELIPSLDPTERESVHMKSTMWDMTVGLSQLLDDYGLDMWFWLALDGDVRDTAVAEEELVRRRALFEACTRIDGIFVPGGDPGDTHPDVLMPWLKRMAEVLHEKHPQAGVWVSNQGFTAEENEAFFGYIEKERPTWLAGVVFGPWVKLSLEDMRAMTPEGYPIRRYPDIGHSLRCQYPVPRWDRAFAHTLGREPFNPRPKGMQQIHNMYAPYSAGAITYSDGVNDDVNKVVWSALGWDPERDIEDILLDYGHYFINESHGNEAAKGLMAFEEAWEPPLSTNKTVEKNLTRWKAIESADPDGMAHNWRLQLCVLRAYYDAYVQRRLAFESGLENEAIKKLADAAKSGSASAIDAARALLAEADEQPEDLAKMRAKLYSFGKILWDSIGMQLDVENYKARNAERGAILEFLDTPLNDRSWLEVEFDAVAGLSEESARLARLDEIVHWEDVAPGSFYDDLGNAMKQPHLVSQKPWEEDPSRVNSPQEEYSKGTGLRLSWLDQAQTLYGTPLLMHYDNLDPKATYRLRVTYAGRFRATVRLVANGDVEIHDALPQPQPFAPVSYSLPAAVTQSGTLDLAWHLLDGRGVQVAEVWLEKE